MKNLKQLSAEIHAINREKGFWYEPKTEMQCLLLVQSELFEALEAHRKGRITAPSGVFDLVLNAYKFNMIGASAEFENFIKDTMGDELADIVIRLLDFAAAFKLYEETGSDLTLEDLENTPTAPTEYFFEFIHRQNMRISMMIDMVEYKDLEGIRLGIASAIRQCFRICPSFGINLESHIQAKIEYNKTRPIRHNKNY